MYAGPPRQRCVLAALAVDAGRPVQMDTLIGRVWGHMPPDGAHHAIYVYVSRIRGMLRAAAGDGAPVALARRSRGYVLGLAPDRIDVHRFRALVAQAAAGPNERSARSLRDALDLWHGTPLADVPGDWAARTREAWRQQYVETVATWAQAELRLANPAAVITPLTELVAEQPLAEKVVAILMQALLRTGHAADALDYYGATRQRLAEQLGVDPGLELRRAHELVLRGEADPPESREPAVVRGPGPVPRGADRPVPAQLPWNVVGFCGRTAEIAALDAVLPAHDSQPSSKVVVLSGMAGVGKTALAVHWAHRVAARFADGQLYVDLRGFDPGGSVMPSGDAVRGFLDALGVAAHRVPTDAGSQAALYRSVLAGKRILVVLDNARDADQVRPLLPGTPGCLVVVTSRNEMPGLLATTGAHPLTVDLLTAAESRQLLACRIGADRLDIDSDATDEMIARCGRLPLALAIAAARAASRPDFTLAALAGQLRDNRNRLDAFTAGDPATDVRAVFSWSYLALGSPAARLFRLLGLHPGPSIGVSTAASLAGVPPESTRALLAGLTRAHLIAEPTPDRYVLHDLLHAYATEQARRHDCDDTRRAAVHRMLDHYLHTAHTAALLLNPRRPSIIDMPPPADVTIAPLSDQNKAAAWLTTERPALLAAVRQASDIGLDTHAWRIAWTLTDFLDQREHWDDLAAAHDAALAAAVRLADVAGQAYAHRGLSSAHTQRGRYGEADVHLQRALELFSTLGDHIASADTLLDLSYLFERQGRNDEALDGAQAALALLATIERPTERARALNNVGWYCTLLGRHQDALTYCRQALDLYKELGDCSGQAATLDSLGHAHYHLAHHEQAVECRQLALDLCRNSGNIHLEASLLIRLGETHDAAGDRRAAHDAWRHAADLLDAIGHPDADTARTKLRPTAQAETIIACDFSPSTPTIPERH